MTSTNSTEAAKKFAKLTMFFAAFDVLAWLLFVTLVILTDHRSALLTLAVRIAFVFAAGGVFLVVISAWYVQQFRRAARSSDSQP